MVCNKELLDAVFLFSSPREKHTPGLARERSRAARCMPTPAKGSDASPWVRIDVDVDVMAPRLLLPLDPLHVSGSLLVLDMGKILNNPFFSYVATPFLPYVTR